MRTLFFLLVASPLFAGEATIERKFTLDASPEEVSFFVQKQPDLIAKKLGIKVIEHKGNLCRIQVKSPLGANEITVKETSIAGNGTWVFYTDMVEKHTGNLTAYKHSMTLTEANGKTSVVLKMSAQVDHPEAADTNISLYLFGSSVVAEEALRKGVEPKKEETKKEVDHGGD